NSVPDWSSFDHVNTYCASRPCHTRWMTLACSESYQVRPWGAHNEPRPVLNCGNGRSDCATEALAGNPAYGSLFWKRPAAVEPIAARRIPRSARLLISRPAADRAWGVTALYELRTELNHHAPRLAT